MPVGTTITGIGALFYLFLSLIGLILRLYRRPKRNLIFIDILLPGILLLVFAIVSTSLVFGLLLANYDLIIDYAFFEKWIVGMHHLIIQEYLTN